MIDVSKILENVTRFDLSKGMNYNKNHIKLRQKYKEDDIDVMHFHVISQTRSYYYDTYINYFNGEVYDTDCDCPSVFPTIHYR